MFGLNSLVALMPVFVMVAQGAIAPRASSDTCTYSCPNPDRNGRAFTNSNGSNNNLLKCNYSGGNPCEYNPSTGDKLNGGDNCKATATGSGSCTVPCAYACPTTDAQNHEYSGNNGSSASRLKCNYFGSNPCEYNRSNGAINNGGNNCRATATYPGTCSAGKRSLNERKSTFAARANKPRVVVSPDMKAIIARRRNLRISKDLSRRASSATYGEDST